MPFSLESTIEHLAIEVDVDGAKLLAINVYIPPTSSVDIMRDVLGMGNFNPHDARWRSHTLDTAAAAGGNAICCALVFGELMCINENSHTRRPQNGQSFSSDLTFTNPHLGINARWEPLMTLNPDHLPIIVNLDG